ncbi:MAG: DUF362 domain-containing protein [Promethearchaeota archaeon]
MSKAEVAAARGDSLEEALGTTLDLFFKGSEPRNMFEGKKVFVKIDISHPTGPPVTTDPRTLRLLVKKIGEFSPARIGVGGVPGLGFKGKVVCAFLGLEPCLVDLNADLAYLDDLGTRYIQKSVENRDYSLPSEIFEADVYISLSPGKTHPLFDCSLSCLNASTVLRGREIPLTVERQPGREYCFNDTYQDHFVRRVADILEIRAPDLAIVDCFHFLEGQGTSSFGSRVATPGFFVVGNNVVATDAVTLDICGFDPLDNRLLRECSIRGLGEVDPSKVTLRSELGSGGFRPRPAKIDLNAGTLKPARMDVKKGNACSGCLVQFRGLLDILNSLWAKDIGSLGDVTVLVGENPLEPDDVGHTIVFGDCAIDTTQQGEFRKIVKKKVDKKGVEHVSVKPNKKVCQFPGCPPNAFDFFELALKFYGKKALPNTAFFKKSLDFCFRVDDKKEAKIVG